MRQLTIGILCSTGLLAAAACNKSPDGQGPEATNATGTAAPTALAYYTVEADKVANTTITAVKGTFRMVNATAANGIQSSGTGGACLVFTAKDLDFPAMDAKKCTSNESCYHDPEDPSATGENAYKAYSYVPAGSTRRENSYGYCDTQNKQCWSKPVFGNDAVCNRPIQMTAGTVNPVPKTPVDVSPWVKQGSRVRVVACLNGGKPPFPSPGAPCGQNVSSNRIEVLGDPIPVPQIAPSDAAVRRPESAFLQ